MTENSYEVIILYMLEIDYYWQKFLKRLEGRSDSNLKHQILQILSSKKSSFELNFETLTSIQGGVSKFFVQNKFRQNLVHNKIFSEVIHEPVNNLGEFFNILIEIENRTKAFFQEYFGMLPYLKTKELLDRIIKEKEQEIARLQEYGA